MSLLHVCFVPPHPHLPPAKPLKAHVSHVSLTRTAGQVDVNSRVHDLYGDRYIAIRLKLEI